MYLVGALGYWRWLTASCILAIFVWTVLLTVVPETPAHLLAKGYVQASACACACIYFIFCTLGTDGSSIT